jgi:predicted ABC-type sugar transport system permease subunit
MGALIHYFKLQPFIVTLAGMFLARGLCYLISIDSITIDDPLFVAMSQAQLPLLGGFLSPGAVIALVVLAVAIWSRTARLRPRRLRGRRQRAVGADDGLPVGAHQGAGLRLQRLLRRAGRRAVLVLHACPATACMRRARSSTRSRRWSSAARC